MVADPVPPLAGLVVAVVWPVAPVVVVDEVDVGMRREVLVDLGAVVVVVCSLGDAVVGVTVVAAA